ncbi:MAG: acyl-CoA dehydrogenase family protein, partial [Longimicrobiales bacterium]
MDLSWNPEQLELGDRVLDFARRELTTDVIALDRESRFDDGAWRKCGEFGIPGLPVPEEYGGLGQDPLTTMLALETLGYGCKDNGLLFSLHAHMWTSEMPLLAFGTADQKRRYLPELCSGRMIAGNGVSEPGSGSDAYGMTTRALRKGDRYVLNGAKTWV